MSVMLNRRFMSGGQVCCTATTGGVESLFMAKSPTLLVVCFDGMAWSDVTHTTTTSAVDDLGNGSNSGTTRSGTRKVS
jgi:hypothetical protein